MAENSTEPDSTEADIERAVAALTGGAAGLCLWFVAIRLPELIGQDNGRLILTLTTFSGGFFAVFLAAMGPLRVRAAASVAASLALVGAGLLLWASFRYGEVGDFIASGHVLVAYVVLVTIPVPFLIAALSPGEGWRNYPALFSHAWQIFMRYLVAWAFTGLFWLVIMLSDQVLKIVGLEVIERLLQIDPVPFVLSGLVLGLGLAVVHELRDYVSPYLALRLLRLLLPLVLLVSVVFLVAVPLRGLSGLFGGISSATVLMAMAMAAATLVTTVLDTGRKEAATSVILVQSARAMALIMPLLGGLAGWAVWLRVAQYGWTPTRLAAALAALVVLAYGLSYGLAVLRGAGWMARIRRANIAMALVLVALAALWLSPVLNGERLSVNSQMARFEDGRISADELDLWAMGREWGRAGEAAIARLENLDHPERRRLDERLALLGETQNRWQWQAGERASPRNDQRQALLEVLELRPEGATLPVAAFADDGRLGRWLAGCARLTPAGNPGCIGVVSDFLPYAAGNEVLVLHISSNGELRAGLWGTEPGPDRAGIHMTGEKWSDPAQIDRILQEGLRIDTAPQDILLIGESVLSIGP